MTTAATLGMGTTFGVETAAGSGTFTVLGEVTHVTAPAASVDSIEVTHMGSGASREFIAGLIDPGEVQIDMNLAVSSGTDDFIHAWLEARETRAARITFPNSTTWTFQAFATGYSSDTPTDDKQTASLTAKVTGSVVRT